LTNKHRVEAHPPRQASWKWGKAVFDLIVIGAGPAGSAAAYTAAASGLDVLLIEKERFPRPKPCGGAISERALFYMDGDLPASLQENEIYGAKISYKGKSVEVVKEHRIALLIARDQFDHYLLQKALRAGVLIQKDKVHDFFEEDDFVRVYNKQRRQYRAKYVIIAEGAHGKLKYKIKGRESKDRYGFGLVAELKPPGTQASALPPKIMEFRFGITPRGYGWIFPHQNHDSVGIYGIACHMKGAKNNLQALCGYSGFTAGCSPKGHIIPLGWPRKKLTGKRTLLCGDAGGFVDTFSGEGIAYAVRSGQIAAQIIAAALPQDDATGLTTAYEKGCREEFDDNLKYAFWFAEYLRKYPDLLFPIFTGDERMIHDYLDVPAMKATYKQLFYHLLRRAFPQLPGLLRERLRVNAD